MVQSSGNDEIDFKYPAACVEEPREEPTDTAKQFHDVAAALPISVSIGRRPREIHSDHTFLVETGTVDGIQMHQRTRS